MLHNRGSGFVLQADHPNRLEPGKRPFHTLIPAMVFKDGRLLMTYGVMGGDIQAQGHAQVLINLIDRGLNLQQAIDAPRVRYVSGRGVMLEDTLPPSVIAALVARGHERVLPPAGIMHRALMGGGQAIMIDPTNGRAARGVRHSQGWTRHWLLNASPLPLSSPRRPPGRCGHPVHGWTLASIRSIRRC